MTDLELAEDICALLRQANIDRTFQVLGTEGTEPSIICLTSDPITKLRDPKGYVIKQGMPCYVVDATTGERIIDLLRVSPIT